MYTFWSASHPQKSEKPRKISGKFLTKKEHKFFFLPQKGSKTGPEQVVLVPHSGRMGHLDTLLRCPVVAERLVLQAHFGPGGTRSSPILAHAHDILMYVGAHSHLVGLFVCPFFCSTFAFPTVAIYSALLRCFAQRFSMAVYTSHCGKLLYHMVRY